MGEKRKKETKIVNGLKLERYEGDTLWRVVKEKK